MKRIRGCYRLTRRGRLAVCYGAVNEIQSTASKHVGLEVGATMTQVARFMGLKPSTYVRELLSELVEEGILLEQVFERDTRGIVREYFITASSDLAEGVPHE